MKKPENSMEKTKNSKSLDSIAESVQLLFEEVTQSDNQSPIAKA